ncbi:MAG: sulfotransferase [Pseudomonadota bacterium]
MKQLDFIIIGAQKSATTSLFKYLMRHPDINMPGDKEAPYFSDDKLYSKGWDNFCQQYFKSADKNKLWGTASPQYMGDLRVAERIAKQNPKAKLIAILRHPVDRAYSHYTMSVRRDIETRDFSDSVNDLLHADHLHKYRSEIPPDHHAGYGLSDVNSDKSNDHKDTHYYCVWSEYGRILTHYNHFFPLQQLLILTMDELMEEPQQTLNKVTQFLGFKKSFLPTNLGKIYHQGGNQLIIPNIWKERIKSNPLFRFFWDKTSPRVKGHINYWYEQFNVRHDTTSAKDKEPTPKTRQQLVEHFSKDIKLLEKLILKTVPWKEFHPKTD